MLELTYGRRGSIALLTGILVCAFGCSGGNSQPTVTETRTVANSEAPAKVSDQDRFGWQGMPAAEGATESAPVAANTAPQVAPPQQGMAFDYQTPQGWRSAPATQFRNINFVLGDGDAVQCYLTVLSGSGGGVAGNVNRWRTQMGLLEATESDLSDLPTLKVLDQTATCVSLNGTFKGMGVQGEIKNAMLLGALLGLQGHTISIKMVGPAALVTAERDHFKQFCTSLKLKSGAEADASAPPAGMPQNLALPPGHPALDPAALAAAKDAMTSGATSTMAIPPAGGSDKLVWNAPKDWHVKPNQPMRAASFTVPGAAGEADCGVFLLPGAAGGMDANINRWRHQMGAAALSESELAKLPETGIAGKKGKLVEIKGSFQGMNGTPIQDALMLGVICELNGDSLFVKLVGPRATVQPARSEFLEFCNGLAPRLKVI